MPPARRDERGAGELQGLAVLAWLIGEIAVLIEVGGHLGAGRTIVLFLGTSLLGIALLRSGGLAMAARLMRWGHEVAERGEIDSLPVAGNVPRLLAGLLLLAPGFLTDAVGVLVLLPPLRWVVISRVDALLAVRERIILSQAAGRSRRGTGRGGVILGGDIIEGEVVKSAEVSDDPEPDRARPPGALPGGAEGDAGSGGGEPEGGPDGRAD